MFNTQDRQNAFDDGMAQGLSLGKMNAEAVLKFAIDRAYIKLGERNTLDLVQKEALGFLDEIFEALKV